ncbi:chemocyanin-like [Musa acuminata AAA Group]|uniref:chemocyanin-like n=1 Tax=Musa acuminata AAA Group TaxID=214697 RepID=UPI0031DA88BF
MSPTVDLVEPPDKYSSTPVDDDQPLPKLDHLQNDASAMELHSIISYTLFLAFMSVLLLENLVGAASYTVGDAEGWTYGLDYQRWAQKYNFTVGDALLFSYIRGQHDVYRVVEDTFRSCDVSSGVVSSYDSGNDVVNLTRAAKYWFLCNVKGHCRGGMRFGITVARASPSPSGGGDGESPFPTSPPPPLPGNAGASVARTTWWLVVIGLWFVIDYLGVD